MRRAVALIAIAAVALSVAFVGYYFLTTEEREVEYKTYINENYQFKFDYPTDWIFIREWGIPWIAPFGVVENTLENEIGGIITLLVYDKAIFENQLGISLDNLTNYTSSFENIENFTLISKLTEIVIDNVSAIRYSVALTRENITLQFLRELVVKDNYFYEFTVGTKEEKYSDYKPIFEHVIDSFSFIES